MIDMIKEFIKLCKTKLHNGKFCTPVVVNCSFADNLTVNSLAPGKFECNFGYVTFKRILVIDGWGICCEIALIWMSLDFIDDQSTLVQVMAWCRQAPIHYLSQCWPRSFSPYGVTRPQWVNSSTHWGRDKMAAILQTFLNIYCQWKL